jgi:hypothetical protein
MIKIVEAKTLFMLLIGLNLDCAAPRIVFKQFFVPNVPDHLNIALI